MANASDNRYYIKVRTNQGVFPTNYADIVDSYNGVAILKMDGFLAKGKPVNIYTAQWIDSQTEDFLIGKLDANNDPVIIRENVDIELTFIVSQRYVIGNSTINVQNVHDTFVNALTSNDIWLKTSYMGNKQAHCICLKEYKPTMVKLGRGNMSYIMGTIVLHTLDVTTTDVAL